MSRPTLKEIRSAAINYFDSTLFLSTTPTKREITRQRQSVHFVAHEIFGHSCSTVGTEFGEKDHATVLHSCKVISNEKDSYQRIGNYVSDLKDVCIGKHKENRIERAIKSLLKSKSLEYEIRIEVEGILNEHEL